MCDRDLSDVFGLEDSTSPAGRKVKCKGVFFRYGSSAYVSSHRSIEFRESYRFLKRKSCKGCDECEYFWEDLSMDDLETCDIDWPEEPCAGDLYKLRYVPGSGPDWEGEHEPGSWAFDKIECKFLPIPIRGREVVYGTSIKGCKSCNNYTQVGVPTSSYGKYFSCMSIEIPWECRADKDKPLAGKWKSVLELKQERKKKREDRLAKFPSFVLRGPL